jgi:hypothetical protein
MGSVRLKGISADSAMQSKCSLASDTAHLGNAMPVIRAKICTVAGLICSFSQVPRNRLASLDLPATAALP